MYIQIPWIKRPRFVSTAMTYPERVFIFCHRLSRCTKTCQCQSLVNQTWLKYCSRLSLILTSQARSKVVQQFLDLISNVSLSHIHIGYTLIIVMFQTLLEFVKINGAVDHAKAFGRIAFSCPRTEVMST